jgi:hypothetical protein
MPSRIPEDLYGRVFELATAITNASEASDDVAYSAGVEELQALFEERARLGKSHPFLTETLADYTSDCEKAVELYRLAIEQSAAFAQEPTHTKHISLAERLAEAGDVDGAREHLALGREAARRADDREAIDHAALVARSLVA